MNRWTPEEICPLCEKRISNAAHAAGKVIKIAERYCHHACTMDHDISIQELTRRIHESLLPRR